jgi:hypothetical protein
VTTAVATRSEPRHAPPDGTAQLVALCDDEAVAPKMNRQCLGRVNGRFIRCTMAEIFVRTAEPFDFDRIEHWGPALKAEVSGLLPSDVARIISAADPESVEDARDELFKVIDRHVIIARASSWIEAGPVLHIMVHV